MEEYSVGGRADGHCGHIKRVHGREANGRAEHGGTERQVRAPQQRQERETGEQSAAKSDLQRINSGLIEAEAGRLREEFREGAAGTP